MTGPGGTGKTRLSLQVAASRRRMTSPTDLFVALDAVRDPTLVAPSIARTLASPRQSPGAVDRLAAEIGDRPVLLVLDNFEQVTAAGPDVADLLKRCEREMPRHDAHPAADLRGAGSTRCQACLRRPTPAACPRSSA